MCSVNVRHYHVELEKIKKKTEVQNINYVKKLNNYLNKILINVFHLKYFQIVFSRIETDLSLS